MANNLAVKPFFVFRLRYFIWAVVLFIIEVIIALYVRDRFVRPYLGDFLVVILLYCAIKTVVNRSNMQIGIAVLLFAYCIEAMQYFHFVDRIGLADNKLARIVIGYGFEWWDMLAYTLGVIFILIIDKRK